MEHLVTTEELIDELRELVPRSFLYSLSLLSDERIAKSSIPFNTVEEFVYGNVGSGGLGLRESELYSMIAFNFGTHKDSEAREQIKRFRLTDRVDSAGVLNPQDTGGFSIGYKKENVTNERGNSADYRIAKLKRDFGEDAVIEASKNYKSVSALERHFGVGKPIKTKMERLVDAFHRLSETEQDEFLKRIKNG